MRKRRAKYTKAMEKRLGVKVGTNAVLEMALVLAQRIKANVVLLLSTGRVDRDWLEIASQSFKLILVVNSKRLFNFYKKRGYDVILSTPSRLARFSRIRHAVITAMSKRLIKRDQKMICLTGPVTRNIIDCINVLRTGKVFREMLFFGTESSAEDASLGVIECVLDIAVEIATFGREGRAVGAIFVIGDTANVLKNSRQITFNPFKGYDDKRKNITDPDVRESIKEFAQIDGAFVIRADGTVNACGRLLLMPKGEVQILKGYGARHNAAAYITKQTKAIAIVVSESSRTVTVFKKGRVLFSFEPAESYKYPMVI
ncbi:MAG: diadenylate cyclase [Candidatus Zixiibacteriota bacterium]